MVLDISDFIFMARKKVYLKLSNASTDKVLATAGGILNMLTDNPDFPAPSPPLADIQQEIDNVHKTIVLAKAALGTYKEKLEEIKQQKDHLLDQLHVLGNYVGTIANGDDAMILGAGFETKKKGVKKGKLPAPLNLQAKEGLNSGQLLAKWQRVIGAQSYIVEINENINDKNSWHYFASSTKTNFTLNKLKSGTVYFIRVAALNAAGQGAYSDISMRMVI